MPILSAIFVTIATVKLKKMSEFYTSAILLINESKEICEKQISVFCSKGGHFSPLMHVPLYDKWDDYNFEIVNFPFFDGDDPRSLSYGVYISQLIRFAKVCSSVEDFNNRNLFLTAK